MRPLKPGMRLAAGPLLIATALASIAARAQPPAAAAVPTLALSDAEKADMLAHDTEASVATARSGLGGAGGARRQIHGEIGATIGSRGTRGAFGTAAIPLGDNAGAIVSFETARSGRQR